MLLGCCRGPIVRTACRCRFEFNNYLMAATQQQATGSTGLQRPRPNAPRQHRTWTRTILTHGRVWVMDAAWLVTIPLIVVVIFFLYENRASDKVITAAITALAASLAAMIYVLSSQQVASIRDVYPAFVFYRAADKSLVGTQEGWRNFSMFELDALRAAHSELFSPRS